MAITTAPALGAQVLYIHITQWYNIIIGILVCILLHIILRYAAPRLHLRIRDVTAIAAVPTAVEKSD